MKSLAIKNDNTQILILFPNYYKIQLNLFTIKKSFLFFNFTEFGMNN